jgi:hypothetical protein
MGEKTLEYDFIHLIRSDFMSYEIKVGQAAEEAMTAEKKDYSKLLAKFKDGSVYRVKIPGRQVFAQYFCHSVFGKFYTTVHSEGDLYCQASNHFYELAKQESDEKKSEELRQKGYELKKKERYMFGFFDLTTGEEIIIDVTQKQATMLLKTISKYDGKYGKFAFEISKSGKGQNTIVSLDPIVDMDDLKSSESENFAKLAEKEFDKSAFGKVFTMRNESEQIEDLTKYGMDTSVLKVSQPASTPAPTPAAETEEVTITDEDIDDVFTEGEYNF